MRNYILKQYTSFPQDSIVIGHHGSCHTRVFFQTLFGMILLRITYTGLSYFIPFYIVTITWITGILGTLLYLHFVVEFLNKHLDACIITKSGITIFEWEGFLRYNSQQFDWETIESISHSQYSFIDKILHKGSINIIIEHGVEFIIDDITNPQQVAQRIRKYRQDNISHSRNISDGEEIEGSHEKFDILVETLGEVIKDYMGKQQLPNKKREL